MGPRTRRTLLRPLAAAVLVTFTTACAAHRPVGPPPPEPPKTGTYQEGFEAGTDAGNAPSVVPYAVGGFLAAPLIALIVVALASGGGGSGCGGGGSSCGNGDGGGASTPRDADVRTPEYIAGYRDGYEKAWKPRKERALLGGFIAGVVVMAGVLGFLYFREEERKRNQASSNPAAAPPEPFGLQIRF